MAPLKTQHTHMSLCVLTHTDTEHIAAEYHANICTACFFLCLEYFVMSKHDHLRRLYPTFH